MLFADSAFSAAPFCAPSSAGNFIAANIAETAAGTDAVIAQLNAVGLITSQTQANEVVTSAGSILSVLTTEFADAADAIASTTDWQVLATETATALDTSTNTSTMLASAVAAAAAVATPTNTVIAADTITETAQGFDTSTRRVPWELIADDQTPGWTNIDTF